MKLATELLDKAGRAAKSAKLLLEAEDADGACSRAYYAMYDAARAALILEGFAPEALKTHASVIGQFSLRLVKTGQVPRDVGKARNDVQEIRQLADYFPAEVPFEKAQWAVSQAQRFIDTVRALPSLKDLM